MRFPSWFTAPEPAVEVSEPLHDLTLDMRRFSLEELQQAVYQARFEYAPDGFDAETVVNHALYRVEQFRKVKNRAARRKPVSINAA